MTYTAERYQPGMRSRAIGASPAPYSSFNSRLEVGIPGLEGPQLMLRDKLNVDPDNPMHLLLSVAVENATHDFIRVMKTDTDHALYEQIQTPQETEEHAMYYADAVIDSIAELDSGTPEDDRPITIVSMATGGFAPTKAIMDLLGDHPLADRVQYVAIDHTPNPALAEVLNNGKGTIIVDDGMTTGISVMQQVVEPYMMDPDTEAPQAREFFAAMKRKAKEVGSCNDQGLMPDYEVMLGILESKNIILAPMYTRNRAVAEVFRQVSNGRDTPWTRAQAIITDPSAIFEVNEGVEVVGASIAGLPCRDLGTTIDQLLELGLEPAVADAIQQEGLGHVEARHMSRLRGLIQLTEEGERVARIQLVERLNDMLMNWGVPANTSAFAA